MKSLVSAVTTPFTKDKDKYDLIICFVLFFENVFYACLLFKEIIKMVYENELLNRLNCTVGFNYKILINRKKPLRKCNFYQVLVLDIM